MNSGLFCFRRMQIAVLGLFAILMLEFPKTSHAYILTDDQFLEEAREIRTTIPKHTSPICLSESAGGDLVYLTQIAQKLDFLQKIQDRVKDGLHYPLVRQLYSAVGKNIHCLSNELKSSITHLLPDGVHWITLENFAAIYDDEKPLIVPKNAVLYGSDIVSEQFDAWGSVDNLLKFLQANQGLSNEFLHSILIFDLPILNLALKEVRFILDLNQENVKTLGKLLAKDKLISARPKLTYARNLVSYIRSAASLFQLLNFSSKPLFGSAGQGEYLGEIKIPREANDIPFQTEMTPEQIRTVKAFRKKVRNKDLVFKNICTSEHEIFTFYKSLNKREITPEVLFNTFRLLGESCTQKNFSYTQLKDIPSFLPLAQYCRQFVELRNASEHLNDPHNYFLIKYIELNFEVLGNEFFHKILRQFRRNLIEFASEAYPINAPKLLPAYFETLRLTVEIDNYSIEEREKAEAAQEEEAESQRKKEEKLKTEKIEALKSLAQDKKDGKRSHLRDDNNADEDDCPLFEEFFGLAETEKKQETQIEINLEKNQKELGGPLDKAIAVDKILDGSQDTVIEVSSGTSKVFADQRQFDFNFLEKWRNDAKKQSAQGLIPQFKAKREFKIEVQKLKSLLLTYSPESENDFQALKEKYLKNTPFRFSLDHHFMKAVALLKCQPSKRVDHDLFNLFKKARNLIAHYSWLDDPSTNLPFLPLENFYNENLPPAYYQSSIILDAAFKLVQSASKVK